MYTPLFCLSPHKYICSFGGSGGWILVLCPTAQPLVLPINPYRAAASSTAAATQLQHSEEQLPQISPTVYICHPCCECQRKSSIRLLYKYGGWATRGKYFQKLLSFRMLCPWRPVQNFSRTFCAWVQGGKKLFHSLTQYFLLLSRGWVSCCSLLPCSTPCGRGCSPVPVAAS